MIHQPMPHLVLSAQFQDPSLFTRSKVQPSAGVLPRFAQLYIRQTLLASPFQEEEVSYLVELASMVNPALDECFFQKHNQTLDALQS